MLLLVELAFICSTRGSLIYDKCSTAQYSLTNSEESASLAVEGGPIDCPVHKTTEVDARGLTTNFHLSCQLLLSVDAIVVIMFVAQCKDSRLFVTCDKFMLVTFLNEAADN